MPQKAHTDVVSAWLRRLGRLGKTAVAARGECLGALLFPDTQSGSGSWGTDKDYAANGDDPDPAIARALKKLGDARWFDGEPKERFLRTFYAQSLAWAVVNVFEGGSWAQEVHGNPDTTFSRLIDRIVTMSCAHGAEPNALTAVHGGWLTRLTWREDGWGWQTTDQLRDAPLAHTVKEHVQAVRNVIIRDHFMVVDQMDEDGMFADDRGFAAYCTSYVAGEVARRCAFDAEQEAHLRSEGPRRHAANPIPANGLTGAGRGWRSSLRCAARATRSTTPSRPTCETATRRTSSTTRRTMPAQPR